MVRVEASRSLRWWDVVDTLAGLGFKVAKEEPLQISIHVVVRFYGRDFGLTREVPSGCGSAPPDAGEKRGAVEV